MTTHANGEVSVSSQKLKTPKEKMNRSQSEIKSIKIVVKRFLDSLARLKLERLFMNKMKINFGWDMATGCCG